PFERIKELKYYWENPEDDTIDWIAPDGMFWICGNRAYTHLPRKWKGTCTIGIILPGFFLLPKSQKKIRDTFI
ncbi:ENR1 protein, partial [Amazona guildingii]|nr:ENR1 protein [Amazona guildingii]